jgi:hypothetical protein
MAQLALSGVKMPPALLGVSLGLFAVSAAMEGGITLAVTGALERMNPGWMRAAATPAGRGGGVLLVAAILLASIGALFASALPDGLEKLSEGAGIAEHARSLFQTPLADYEASFFQQDWLRKSIPGILGLAAVYVVVVVAGRMVSRRALHRS